MYQRSFVDEAKESLQRLRLRRSYILLNSREDAELVRELEELRDAVVKFIYEMRETKAWHDEL